MNDKIEETVKKAKEVAAAAYKKTGEVINVQKQKLEVAALNSKLKTQYEKLGRLLFKELSGTENGDVANVAAQIRSIEAEIEERSAEIRNAKGKTICRSCNKEVPADAIFCAYCGSKLGEE